MTECESLFDVIARTDSGPAKYSEPEFTYINRSARTGFERVRQVTESWYSRYPDEHKAELRSRFRSTNDSQHRSAFFELFMHEMLRVLGCEVQIHPDIVGSGKHPDFFVECEEGCRFFLEAVLATGESDVTASRRARMNEFYDAINRLESPDFYIGMDIRGAPDTPPPARRVRHCLERWLTGMDYEDIARLFDAEGLSGLPRHLYEHDGWEISFFPIPKSPKSRGNPDIRPIGIEFYKPRFLERGNTVKGAIEKKAGRYGCLGHPYVIAVNAIDLFADLLDVEEALFGRERVVVGVTNEGEIREAAHRVADGVWFQGEEPTNTGLSAVLIFFGLYSYRMADVPSYLFHNPWASIPYTSVLTRLSECEVCDDEIVYRDGEMAGVRWTAFRDP